ncbi:hypothetical protein BpHYR1_017386 [Brachionus plicatilis]|uniref:Uncharacterized protein n=1 Tax=Brachionus plicatilis TaxID=10195 RepID=A0A3M7RI70_BRAPC|nr:hypothetical protein BpHYR1_017386 [Brachionus plicatilis]
MVVLEQKSSPCYKICIRVWKEYQCFFVELFKINLLLNSTHNIKAIDQLLTKYILDTIQERCKKLPYSKWYPLKFSYQTIAPIL